MECGQFIIDLTMTPTQAQRALWVDKIITLLSPLLHSILLGTRNDYSSFMCYCNIEVQSELSMR